jgi:tRNA A37 N6-isopentenylltransferase MiaA
MEAELTVATDEKISAWRRSILSWACKRSTNEINERIDDLITQALNNSLRDEVREKAKCEASELAKIIKRRG